MCGGGPKGPSAEEIRQQTLANQALAEAETKRIKAEQDREKATSDAKTLSESVSQANADQARRARNRTLLAGVGDEEGNAFDKNVFTTDSVDLEDPDAPSVKKAKRAKTLIGGF